MFFFLVLLMSVAGIVIWALMLGIGWRMMLALESLVRAQREVVEVMRKQQMSSPLSELDRELDRGGHVIVET